MNRKIYTQKHFVDIAEFISNLNLENKYQFAQELAKHFQAQNSKFKVERFFKVCGILLTAESEDDGQPTEQKEIEDLEGTEQEIYYDEE